MENVIKKYSNREIAIVWNSGLCQHAGFCGRGLPGVFNPKIRHGLTLRVLQHNKLSIR